MKTSLNLMFLVVLFVFVACAVMAQDVASADLAPAPPKTSESQSQGNDRPERTNAAFPGGAVELSRYFQTQVQYPELAREQGIEGSVVVEFRVDSNGTVTEPVVVQTLGYGCDEAALEAIANMPAWQPARRGAKNIGMRVRSVIGFRLQ